MANAVWLCMLCSSRLRSLSPLSRACWTAPPSRIYTAAGITTGTLKACLDRLMTSGLSGGRSHCCPFTVNAETACLFHTQVVVLGPVWVKSFIFTRNSHNMPFPQAAGTRHTGARTRRAACALSRSTTLPTRSPRSSSVRTAQRQGKTLLPPGKVSHLNKRVRKDDFIQTGSGQTEGILNGKGPFSAEFFLAQACSSSPAQPPVVLLVHIPLFLDELQVRESGLSPTFCLRNDQFTQTGSGQP